MKNNNDKCSYLEFFIGSISILKNMSVLNDLFLVLTLFNSVLPTSLVAQTVKCLPTMKETWVRSLGWEDPLGKEMTTHSSILASKIPRTEDPSRLPFVGSQRVGHD